MVQTDSLLRSLGFILFVFSNLNNNGLDWSPIKSIGQSGLFLLQIICYLILICLMFLVGLDPSSNNLSSKSDVVAIDYMLVRGTTVWVIEPLYSYVYTLFQTQVRLCYSLLTKIIISILYFLMLQVNNNHSGQGVQWSTRGIQMTHGY